uniref:Uncharacterized protein n=1 Tax=Anguilla anguilla TaxID=7936 RepID=A0A0E9PCM4_ANGAN
MAPVCAVVGSAFWDRRSSRLFPRETHLTGTSFSLMV